MKKIISMIGIASMFCLAPACKKTDVKPAEPAKVMHGDTASLYVLLDSKACATAQTEYNSATVDIRGIKVFNTTHGWEDLTPVPGAWDVVSLQTAPVPVADLTENTRVHTGVITKIALTIGDNNQLVVNNAQARCYNIATKEIVLELEGELKANTLNEIVISIDICGNIQVTQHYNQDPCYTLNPVMAFQSFKMVK
jgi:hypothetical protein